MRTTVSKLGVIALAVLLAGCPLLKKLRGEPDADVTAEEDPADADTVTVSGTGAKNEKDVLRYANEEKIDDEDDVFDRDMAVRTFPRNGPIVITLPTGTRVTKIAKYFNTSILVVFDDPAEDGTKLMGWVPPAAFEDPAGKPHVKPPSKPKAVVTPKTDAGTPAAAKDAGATSDSDAGASPKDAGAPAADAGAATKDAGATPAPAGPGKADITFPLDEKGKCPKGFIPVKPLCRRSCTNDASCPRTTFCITGADNKKYCSTDKK
jgi:hypothetical protein